MMSRRMRALMEQRDQYCDKGSYYDGCACAIGTLHK